MIKFNLAPIVFIYANIFLFFILGSIFIDADEVSESILRMVRHRKVNKLEILNSKIVWTDNRIWSKSNEKWKFCNKKMLRMNILNKNTRN